MNEITKWDYDESVNRMKPLVVKWRTMTIEMLQELWTARENLRAQGARTDLTSGNLARGWETYCEEIGLPKRTANHWLSQYDAAEKKLIEAPGVQGFVYSPENIAKFFNSAIDEYHIRGKAVTEGYIEDWGDVIGDEWWKGLFERLDDLLQNMDLPQLIKMSDLSGKLANAAAVHRLRLEQAAGKILNMIDECDKKIKELSKV